MARFGDGDDLRTRLVGWQILDPLAARIVRAIVSCWHEAVDETRSASTVEPSGPVSRGTDASLTGSAMRARSPHAGGYPFSYGHSLFRGC